MDFKELVNSNFSRKAELVVVTIAGICYVAGLDVVDGTIITLAIKAVTIVGGLGIFCQAVIDFFHPKHQNGNTIAPPVRDETLDPAVAATIEGAKQ